MGLLVELDSIYVNEGYADIESTQGTRRFRWIDLVELRSSWEIRHGERDGGREVVYAKSCNAAYKHLSSLEASLLPSFDPTHSIADHQSMFMSAGMS